MTPRKPPSDEQLREAFGEVGDALQRAVVLSSDRVQSVFEDAVLRGRMTRRDAEELASSLVALGRDQALELRSEVDALARSLPTKVAEAVDAAAVKPRAKLRGKRKAGDPEPGPSPAERAEAKWLASKGSPKTAAPAAVPGGVPADASARPAKELIALIPGLTPAELRDLHAQESAAKARATVLRAIDAKLKA